MEPKDAGVRRPYLSPDKHGAATWFVGSLMIQKAGAAESGGAFDVLDQLLPPGYAPPRHVHAREDEAWYILDGRVTFWCGARTFEGAPHAFVLLPKGEEHTFKVGDEGARMLTLTIPSGFADFVRDVGEPARALEIPASAPIDQAKLAEVAGRYGIDITGPPPE